MLHESPLASVLGHELAAQFRRDHFPGKLFHHRADSARWPAWLQNEALRQPARFDAAYEGALDATRGRRATYRVSGATVSRLVEDLDLTVRLGELDRHLPGATDWLRALERELGLPERCCELHGFVNAPGVGLGAHCDPCEHLLIHVSGHKQIRVLPSPDGTYYGSSHTLGQAPTARDAAQREQGYPRWGAQLPSEAQTLALEPGSVLFMPRGCYHETRGGNDGVSVSVVVRMRIPSYAELWLDYLRDYLLQDANWRAPAPALFSDRLNRLLERTELRHAPSEARFVRNPSVQVQVDGATLRIRDELGRGATREHTLSTPALTLVEAVSERRAPFALAELSRVHSDWDEAALATIVSFLVRQQVLITIAIAPFRHAERSSRVDAAFADHA